MDDPKLLEVLEVFAARICHDLVGAVGAVSNGVELLSEGGEAADPEVLALISSSARTASRRLQYFRTAFGTGSALSATRPLDGARSLAASFLEEGKVALDWAEPPAAAEAAAGRRAAKAVLNLVIVAADCLPRGVPSWIVRALVDGAKGNVDVTEGQDMVVLGLRVPRQY